MPGRMHRKDPAAALRKENELCALTNSELGQLREKSCQNSS